MLFSDIPFLYYFLPAVLFVYYVPLRNRRFAQNIFLLCASLFFYAYGEPRFVPVMIASIIAAYVFALLIGKSDAHPVRKKLLLIADIVFHLGILFVFKYLTFSASLLSSLTGAAVTLPEIRLPIGISFFTFQALSYVIDVYRGKVAVQKSFFAVGLYISFFPQLIAGPIVRYETIEHQILNRKENTEDFFNGFARFVMGLSKKILLANSFALIADTAHARNEELLTLSVGFAWLGAIAYTLQIYFDFSGYSDMAIGLGKMFGFHFLENFRYPYTVTSVSSFWRHWHISLGSWFRDYVYIPLGGSRVSTPRLLFNLFTVWLLTGLWHGASLNFVVWGLMYFVLLSAEKLAGTVISPPKLIAHTFGRLYALLYVILGWVLFRASTLTDAWRYLLTMAGRTDNPLSDGMFTGYAAQNTVLIVIGLILCTPVFPALRKRFSKGRLYAAISVPALVALFVLCVSSLTANAYNPFIYFRF